MQMALPDEEDIVIILNHSDASMPLLDYVGEKARGNVMYRLTLAAVGQYSSKQP